MRTSSNIVNVLSKNLLQKNIFYKYYGIDDTFLKKWDGNNFKKQKNILNEELINVVSDMKEFEK